MDRQLHTQFVDSPFMVDPMSTTYTQLFEWAHMDAFLMQAKKTHQHHQLHGHNSVCGGRQEYNHATNRSPIHMIRNQTIQIKVIPFRRDTN